MQFATDFGLRMHKMLTEFSFTFLKLCVLSKRPLYRSHMGKQATKVKRKKARNMLKKNHKHGNLDECLIYVNYSLFS